MPSWRDGLVSDWTVTLGDKAFLLHRWQLLQKSGFFAAQFNEGYEASGTDLTRLLPPATWVAFETCLDYMYGELAGEGLASVAPELTLPLLKISDCLAVSSLLADCTRACEELVRSDPLALLAGADGVVEAEGDPVLRLVERALEAVRLDFEAAAAERAEELLRLPPAVARRLLGSDVLDVGREDAVLHFLQRYAGCWASEADGLWQLLRVPFLSAEGVLQLHQMGLEERVGLPLRHGLLLRLALQEAKDQQAASRLCRDLPALASWCVPRAQALQPAVVRKSRRGNPNYTALLGRRPLTWVEGLGRAFELRLDRDPQPAETAESDMDTQSEFGECYVGKLLVGICWESPAATERLTDWESVDYFAVNRCGELIVKSCLVGVAARDPCAPCKGFYFSGIDPYDDDAHNASHLEVGDTLRVCVTEEAKLLVSVNGVPTVSAPLSAARCLCADCTAGLQSLVNDGALPSAWRKGKGKGRSGCGSRGASGTCKGKGKGRSDGLLNCNVYPMVGLPDPSAVTLMPVAQR
eukprot:CAMPEP_0168479824 /NCGR_PEP_ID=MMETSP0228-20121227/63670_1 /TAXON_ID=133427 /ORGANISM="Protoceratium reticulatum, Strain CCCM 535 (=CCMP 1889)" /LENGTH=524 /DNA_ID=CAMNT_0008496123 /DNA_START=1 /DNA_END=1575 /DNA_ORIENTATION=-